jgi:Serine carboxypeptidase/EGF-like domain
VYNAIEPEEYIDWTHFYDAMLVLNGGLDVLVYAGRYDQ